MHVYLTMVIKNVKVGAICMMNKVDVCTLVRKAFLVINYLI